MPLISRVRSLLGMSRAGLAKLTGFQMAGDIDMGQGNKVTWSNTKKSFRVVNGNDIMDDYANDAIIRRMTDTLVTEFKPVRGPARQFTEQATPTPVADVHQVYAKSDDKLYHQDGAGVEHELISGFLPVGKYGGSDISFINDAVVGDTGLLVPVLDTEVWHWEISATWRVFGNNPGMRITMAGPATTWAKWMVRIHNLQGAGGGPISIPMDQPQVVAALGTELTITLDAGTYQFYVSGTALFSAGGNLVLQGAQKTSHAEEARLETGSTMIATRML
jgi:hypothetical protein